MIKLFVITIFALASLAAFGKSSRRYQFDTQVGMDSPDSTSKRTGAASMVKFALSTRPDWFRMVGGFTFLTGGGLSQGEFTMGPHVYPFAEISRSPIQPFVAADGVFGLGNYKKVLRYDFGYGVGVGVDFHIGDKSGLTLCVQQQQATESAQRMWLGYFYQGS